MLLKAPMTQNHQRAPEPDVEELEARSLLSGINSQLLSSAAFFDLRQKAERRRSAKALEQLYFRLLRALSPELFVEVGAKSASCSRRARRYLKEGRIIAFEANPFTFERFDKEYDHAALQIEYRSMAISDCDAPKSLRVCLDDQGHPQGDGRASLLRRKEDTSSWRDIEVASTALDQVVNDSTAERCALWLDVEGANKEVLNGGEGALKKAALVFIRVEESPVWSEQWLRPEVDQTMWRAGLLPIARDFGSENRHNVIYMRQESVYSDAGNVAEARPRRYIAEYYSEIGARERDPNPIGNIKEKLRSMWNKEKR